MRFTTLIILLFTSFQFLAQTGALEIKVRDSIYKYPISSARVIAKKNGSYYSNSSDTTDKKGNCTLKDLPYGTYQITVEHEFHGAKTDTVSVRKPEQKVKFYVADLYAINAVYVNFNDSLRQPLSFMKPVVGMVFTSAKKSEVISPAKLDLNEGTNNSRQVYQSVPGLNIWESDGAGIQLGIGGRGLSPHRTSNFNTRQNGYDISADALGYPESYYTPPLEAVERIQLIRGAASLQFGTQFGGMLNFVLHEGGDAPIRIDYKKTIGSNQLSTNFLSAGGSKNRWTYYGFAMHKGGNDFRPNSKFDLWSGHFNTQFHFNEHSQIGIEYTHMQYLAQQGGGLTDAQFEDDPFQSNRDRNWFEVDWNLASVSFNSDLGHSAKFETKFFGLLASRKALGYLGNINRIDPLENRDLIWGEYQNWGNETRFIKNYEVNNKIWILLIGGRYYNGYSIGQQGDADDGYGPNFQYIGGTPDDSDYRFPSKNYSLFAEHIFRLTDQLTVTPGVRFEHIDTRASGTYWNRIYNGAGAIIFEQEVMDSKENIRSFALGGIGISLKPSDSLELYMNFSQNYRSINFTDMQINNPNFRIDPELKDERGFNADVGIRGKIGRFLLYDISGFYLQYSDRIGILSLRDSVLFNVFQYRTNIADSRTAGAESYVNVDLMHWIKPEAKLRWRIFSNLAFIRSEYFNSENSAINGKTVEHVPTITSKIGTSIRIGKFSTTFQFSYVSDQYTDATNAESSPSSVIGIVPVYQVADWSSSIRFSKDFKMGFGINNVFNEYYFTRRAGGYPGPGIIPSPNRNFYLNLHIRI